MGRILSLKDIPFSLDESLSCGQVFKWVKDDEGWWRGVTHDHLIRIKQIDDKLEYSGCDEEFLFSFFHLDADLDDILASIDKDEHIHAAIQNHRGLRILRQDPWECMVSYLCAQNANIPFIERMLKSLSEKYGDLITTEFGTAYSYPRLERLSAVCKEDIENCSTGYRSAYICNTADAINRNADWSKTIYNQNLEDARKNILHYAGIGPKVADCILLFAFQKYSSFPIDRWIDRIMSKYYGVGDPERPLTNSTYNNIRKFSSDYFGEYAGYAQEYLFADRELSQ